MISQQFPVNSMKHLRTLALLPIIIQISPIGTTSASAQQNTELPQSKIQFECVSNRGIPTTIVIGPSGEKPMISWKSTHFANDGWTPESRCKEVTSRISRAYDAGTLRYFTTGRINNMPVICSTSSERGSCESLIYTLKPNQNAGATLKALLKVRAGESGPIEETTSRIYIPLSQFTNGSEFKADKLIDRQTKRPQEGNLF